MRITIKAWDDDYILTDEREAGRVVMILPNGVCCGPWDALRFPGRDDSPVIHTTRYPSEVARYALDDSPEDDRVRALVDLFLSAPQPERMSRGAPPTEWIEMGKAP